MLEVRDNAEGLHDCSSVWFQVSVNTIQCCLPAFALKLITHLQALGLVLGNTGTSGSQAASAFSVAMNNHSISATASVISQTSYSGDSIQDQIYALTHVKNSSSKHLGAIVGSSVGSAVALLVLLATAAVFGRGWLKKRSLQKQAAAWRKVLFSFWLNILQYACCMAHQKFNTRLLVNVAMAPGLVKHLAALNGC